MEALNKSLKPIISQEQSPTSKQLAKRCRAENSKHIWSALTLLASELKLHGSVKDGDATLLEKQKRLTEKLADCDPAHVDLAIKLHQELKPWFPHLSDLMIHIRPLEIAKRERESREAERAKAWHSGKDENPFVDDPDHVRAATVAQWRDEGKTKLAELGNLADEQLLTPAEKEARAKFEARRQAWRDPANDPLASINRLKASMQREAE